MTERKYLKWYNKVGYGSGDVAGNVVYAFLSTFVMIYLTDTAGLNAGIVGTLMMVSKIFDGFTDIIFGSLIDKTKSKLGKARPWMLYPYIGCSLMLIAIFAVPLEWGDVAKYAYFFIAYTLLTVYSLQQTILHIPLSQHSLPETVTKESRWVQFDLSSLLEQVYLSSR